MTTLEIQILITSIVVIWFDLLRLDTVLKRVFGFKPWVKKMDLPFLLKWIACYFCTSFWLGVATVSVLYFFFHLSIYDGIISILLNMIVSKFLDQKQNKL